MSRQSCSQYIAKVENLIQYGGSRNEQSVRFAFQVLLNEYCEAKHRMLIPELDHTTAKGKTVRPDGTNKDQLRMTWGWWEGKDEADDLDEVIALMGKVARVSVATMGIVGGMVSFSV